ncbi:MAG: iron-sulfur cluster carrier protein ApbC [Gammaproteobacteria bacterium]|nr:iron-sulfur cluster carrier protein ApbC [Gammaproteobacteria bacterium]MDH3768851.1 iron-sulfur cluster carrier protein ApbC [Gammaproteobacteria bacterium]
MGTTRKQIEAALSDLVDPYLGTDLVTGGVIEDLQIDGPVVTLRIKLGFAADRYHPALVDGVKSRLETLPDVNEVCVEIKTEIVSHAVQGQLKPLPGVGNIIAVASAKGGVGKSTTAVNIALAMAADGARVGILDADIYGPSQPRMLGIPGARPESRDGKSLEPLEAHGVVCMSVGFLINEDQPMVWRGPMVTQALNQLINDTNWGQLDYLIVDMPPGTGDTQLTLSQQVPVSGAVIVTTPQDIALLDARKGLRMFEKVEVNVLGVVENMSTHVCSQCGHEEHVFDAGGGERMAAEYDVPFLGALPLDIRIRQQVDSGQPTIVSDPDSDLAAAYFDIARGISARLAEKTRDYSQLFPKIVVED